MTVVCATQQQPLQGRMFAQYPGSSPETELNDVCALAASTGITDNDRGDLLVFDYAQYDLMALLLEAEHFTESQVRVM